MGPNCILLRVSITNSLCMWALAYRITHKGGLSRQMRWNNGDHRDWKLLFPHLVSSTFDFLFSSHLVTWGEMGRNWQRTCCCWQQSCCSCFLDMKGGGKRRKKPNCCSLNITYANAIGLLYLKPTPFSCRNDFPPTAVQGKGEMLFVSPSPCPHKENVGWYHFYCSAGVGFRPRISILNV